MQRQLKFTEDGFQFTKPQVSGLISDEPKSSQIGKAYFPQRNTFEDLQHPNKTDALQT